MSCADWECFCAICGGPLRSVRYLIGDEENPRQGFGDTYDCDAFLTRPDYHELGWLDDIQVLGENLETSASSTVWLSGPASVGVNGDVRFDLGDDPDPALADMIRAGSMQAYCREGDDHWAAPFHTKCHEVLRHYLGLECVDNEILNQAFKGMSSDDEFPSCLGIDYGDIGPHRTTDWFAKRHFEYLVCDPIGVEWLERFYKNLPKREQEDDDQYRSYNVRGDPFSRLPFDILLLVTLSLPTMESVLKVRAASPALANLPLSQSYWRMRIKQDMPWLWDMPPPSDEQCLSVSWSQVYRELFRGSHRNETLGLCNRRRIWTQLCPFIGKQYARVAAIKAKWGTPVIPVLENGCEKRPVSWGTLDCRDGVPIISTLVDTLTELETARPSVVLYWGPNGELIDIEIQKGSDVISKTICPSTLTSNKDVVIIPNEDWLAGLIITSREISRGTSQAVECCIVGLDVLFSRSPPVHLGSNEGNKHATYPKEGNFIVALSRHTDDQMIRGLAYVEIPTLWAGCSRVEAVVSGH